MLASFCTQLYFAAGTANVRRDQPPALQTRADTVRAVGLVAKRRDGTTGSSGPLWEDCNDGTE